MTTDYNTRRLAYAIKSYFEINDKAKEILIFKGLKRIPIKRTLAFKSEFFSYFKKAYEQLKPPLTEWFKKWKLENF